VIDIVKGNVNAILQRVWKVNDAQTLILHRMFTKLFNRLLWSHGQGLWNCFSTTGFVRYSFPVGKITKKAV